MTEQLKTETKSKSKERFEWPKFYPPVLKKKPKRFWAIALLILFNGLMMCTILDIDLAYLIYLLNR